MVKLAFWFSWNHLEQHNLRYLQPDLPSILATNSLIEQRYNHTMNMRTTSTSEAAPTQNKSGLRPRFKTLLLVLIVPLILSWFQVTQAQPRLTNYDLENVDRVQAWLAAGGDPNFRFIDGTTPLLRVAGWEDYFSSDSEMYEKDREEILERAVDIARLLIAAGADIDARDPDGYSVLLSATYSCNFALANLLLEQGADIETDGDMTLLITAVVSCGDAEFIRELIRAGAEVNEGVSWAPSPLTVAIRNRDSHTIRVLLDEGANTDGLEEALVVGVAGTGDLELLQELVADGMRIDIRDADGMTPLIQAASERQLDVVRWLLEQAGDGRFDDQLGEALLSAARGNRRSSEFLFTDVQTVLTLLLEAGADAAYEPDDESVLYHVADRASPELIKALIEAGADFDTPPALERAARENTSAAVHTLLEAGATGRGLALVAAVGNDPEIVRMLVDAGADVNYEDIFSRTTALLAAVQINYSYTPDVVEILLAAGADPQIGGRFGYPPLFWVLYDYPDRGRSGEEMAAFEAQLENKLELLITFGADVHWRDDNDQSLLIHAVRLRYLTAINRLLAAGADPNERDAIGMTPLLWNLAEETPNLDEPTLRIQESLIKAGGDIDAAFLPTGITVRHLEHFLPPPGDTPLIRAVKRGETEVIRSLLEAGARTDIQNDEGRHAIQYATYDSEIYAMLGGVSIGVDVWSLAMYADVGTLETVMSRLPVAVNILDEFDQTVLFYATTANRDLEAVRALVGAGVEIDHQDVFGWTALMHAVRDHPDTTIVPVLVELGADTDLQNQRAMTALMIAAESDRPDMVRALLDAGADATLCTNRIVERCGQSPWSAYREYVASDYAAIAGSPEILEVFLQRSPTDIDLNRLLVLAMLANSDLEMMRFLGALGADPNIRLSETIALYPIHLAMFQRSPEKLLLLHELGANLEAQNSFNHAEYQQTSFFPETALMSAVGQGWSEGVDLLLDLGANPQFEDRHGNIALDSASARHPLEERTFQRLRTLSSP